MLNICTCKTDTKQRKLSMHFISIMHHTIWHQHIQLCLPAAFFYKSPYCNKYEIGRYRAANNMHSNNASSLTMASTYTIVPWSRIFYKGPYCISMRLEDVWPAKNMHLNTIMHHMAFNITNYAK